MAKMKSVAEIVSEVYSELEKLQPTTDEIAEFTKLMEGVYRLATYLNEDENTEPETAVTHLIPAIYYVVDFIIFIKKKRRQML